MQCSEEYRQQLYTGMTEILTNLLESDLARFENHGGEVVPHLVLNELCRQLEP